MSNQASLVGITSRFPLSSSYPSAYAFRGGKVNSKLLQVEVLKPQPWSRRLTRREGALVCDAHSVKFTTAGGDYPLIG